MAIALVSVLTLNSCSKSDQIVGKWQWSDNSTSQYLKSGIAISSSGWSGNWEINDNHLSLTLELGHIRAFEIIELSKTTLILKEIGNEKMHTGVRIK